MSAQLQTVDSQQFMRAVTRGIQSMYARMPEIR
jgi:division protein CdvB (Snf7/Vps24/ESCRT-III family)